MIRIRKEKGLYGENFYRIANKIQILSEILHQSLRGIKNSDDENILNSLLKECTNQLDYLRNDIPKNGDIELASFVSTSMTNLYYYLEGVYINEETYSRIHELIVEWESLNNRLISSLFVKIQVDNLNFIDKSLSKVDERIDKFNVEVNALIVRSHNQINGVLRDGIEDIDGKVRVVINEFDLKLKQFETRVKKITEEEVKRRNEYHELIEGEILKFDDEIKNRVYVSVQRIERTASEHLELMDKSKDNISQLFVEYSESIRKISSETKDEAISSIMRDSSVVIDEIKTEQSKGLSSFNSKIDNQVASIEKKITDVVSSFDSRRQDMDNLLEKVGLARDAEVTIIQADKEEKIANNLRLYGCIFLYFSIVVLVILFAEYVGLNFWSGTDKSISDLTFQAFVIRFFTVILISSPAVYLLKESAAHRAKENIYRQRGTQLLTIRGYLSDLPDIERAEVKKSLAENFFSINNGKVDTSNVPDFIKNMSETMRVIRSFKDGELDKSINR